MNIEKVAFKDRKILAQLNENDLLDIIEFLQNDRKQWINQFTQTHNESVEIQKENQELKLELSGYRQAILNNKEMLGLKEQNDKLKKKYVNAVADYVHKDTLTATDYVELNKDNELLTSYNQTLLKENNELKKQLDKAHDELYTLKNKYNIRLLNQISENIEPDCEDYYLVEIETKAHKYDLIQNQQKEFISYLEDKIYSIEPKGTGIIYNCEYDSEEDYVMAMQEQSRLNALKEILKKYKSIIGDVKNEN